jgi:3-oxoacyl-[acyl-carrier-protein] synthase II
VSPPPDVVLTGLGAVTCHGYGVPALRRAMSTAVARPPERVSDPHANARLPLIHPVPGGPGRPRHVPGRVVVIALAAAEEALADAGLSGAERAELAVVVGSCLGDAARWEPEPAEGPVESPGAPPFHLASVLGDRLGAYGVNTSISNACAASGYAICVAADLIRAGEAEMVLAGGADTYSRVGWACFDRLGAVDPVRCRPFDRHRRGTILSEGAGMVVVESRAHAEARGAAWHAAVAGTAWSCDAYHPTAPEPDGGQITRAMRGALAEAGCTGAEVGCVIPHGTGTRLNDVVESKALVDLLGRRSAQTPLYSLKALIGHTGGAAACLATIAGAAVLRAGLVPWNVPLEEQDPQCPVYLPLSGDSPLAFPRVLVNAYAFGGNNAVLVLEGRR